VHRVGQNVINGHGAVHFQRSSNDGTTGQSLEMHDNPYYAEDGTACGTTSACQLLHVEVTAGGSGYTAGAATVTCTGACAAGTDPAYAAPTATCQVDANGAVTSITITGAGTNLDPANPPTIDCSDGTGLATSVHIKSKGFSVNPFLTKDGAGTDKAFTILLVARTTQSSSDTGVCPACVCPCSAPTAWLSAMQRHSMICLRL
jgi:hypothetical protein